MIQATARVLKNVIEIRVGEESWLGRPIEAEHGGLGHRIAALFSTEYHLYRPSNPTVPDATVSYKAKSDEIRIQTGELSWKTHSSLFGPMTVDYSGRQLTIHERLTGKFAILDSGAPVAVGALGFRSCTIRDYPPELETFLVHLSLGYVVRTLTWEALA
jgi:hypothetical protein